MNVEKFLTVRARSVPSAAFWALWEKILFDKNLFPPSMAWTIILELVAIRRDRSLQRLGRDSAVPTPTFAHKNG